MRGEPLVPNETPAKVVVVTGTGGMGLAMHSGLPAPV
jgi:hypothetical protein